ncbi:glycosyltransferase family 2 protein [Chromobacterium amazonense]|uniref:Glycosyltransferase family 2 protein n=1 Tax=Chromobacterium amazonense TaxID=1382803 RepID=A0ABU8UXB1_9NEIS|nr:glycosyltransferase family 2 protein [Chromobacterium amazonense]MDQ4539183.1 glycosyltransferase family 2 protein [Chromobacterium amazonense]
MATLRDANILFQQGNLVEARNKYIKIINKKGPLAHLAATNLELIDSRLQKEGIITELTLKDVYAEISKKINIKDYFIQYAKSPLVSIIVTAHNTEEYIESCILSLINQTYTKREIIIVDDASTDNTQAIAKRLEKTYKEVKYFRLNANLGTYYAKNFGINKSSGEYIFFQDSDDICHPYRIAILASELIKSKKQIVRGCYSRVNPENDQIIKVNGVTHKLGLITLGIRRKVFNEIGYFNCTTKASDEEFFRRAQKYLGNGQIIKNELNLYYNTFRDNSLFSDMVIMRSDGHIDQKPSISRSEYVKEFTDMHESLKKEDLKKIFSFPRIRDAIKVLADMSKLPNPRQPVIVNLCSIPKREESLKKTILSIHKQCDQINLYLDGYTSIPDWLEKYNFNITLSKDLPGLRDNGKFLPLDKVEKDSYYLTIDDDIIYPPDYVNSMIEWIEKFNRKCVIGVHGVILKNNPTGYFSDRRIVYKFTSELEEARAVNLLGTGTLAFHTSTIKDISLKDFNLPGMADLYFGIACKMREIPSIAIPRHENWLSEIESEAGETLYHEFKNNDDAQSKLITRNVPWGISGITSCIRNMKIDDPVTFNLISAATPKLKSLTR